MSWKARIAIESPGIDKAVQGDVEAAQGQRREMSAVVQAAGGTVVSIEQANSLLWLSLDAGPLFDVLESHPQIEWVQLPWAGVEAFSQGGLFTRPITFTCAKAAYGGQVGGHALTLILNCPRNIAEQARTESWLYRDPESLEGKRVTVLGAGGTAISLIRFLRAAECDVTVLRRNDEPVRHADRTLPISKLHAVLPDAVTEPEPLPAAHPLWSMSNVLITSHSADSLAYRTEKLAERVGTNVARFRSQQDLVGVVDPTAGY